MERLQSIADSEPAVQTMLDELAWVGFATEGFGSFGRGVKFDYEGAAPVLLRWLPSIKDPWVRESIARSLTGEPVARELGAARVLVAEFDSPLNTSHTKWVFGNALSTLADASLADDLIDLLREPRHGRGRQMLCRALARTRDPRVADVMIEMIDDDDVAGHAILVLRLRRGEQGTRDLARSRPSLQKLMARSTASPLSRKQAQRALDRLDAAEA